MGRKKKVAKYTPKTDEDQIDDQFDDLEHEETDMKIPKKNEEQIENPLKVFWKRFKSSNYSFFYSLGMEKEKIAGEILFFTVKRQLLMVLLPVLVSLITYFSIPRMTILTGNDQLSSSIVNQFQMTIITSMTTAALFTTMVLIFYYGLIEFQKIKGNGNYGYWLSMGIDRQIFFSYLMFGFVSLLFVGGTLAFILIAIFYLTYLTISLTLLHIIFYFSTVLMMVILSFLVIELTENLEVTIISVALFYSIFLFFTPYDNPIRQFILSVFYITDSFGLLYLFAQLLVTALLGFGTWKIHKNKDIALR
jgi:hypothetical protein